MKESAFTIARKTVLPFTVCVLILGACAGGPSVAAKSDEAQIDKHSIKPGNGHDHEAVSEVTHADQTGGVQPAVTLRADDFDLAAPVSVAEAAKAAAGGGEHAGHAMGHEGHDGAGVKPALREDAAASSDSDDSATTSSDTAVVYTCSMHPEVASPTPGKCPKCGMTLIRKVQK